MTNDISSVEEETTLASNSKSRPIVRRRRPPPLQPSPIKAMSLVGLKNLFFHKPLHPSLAENQTANTPRLKTGATSRKNLCCLQTTRVQTTAI